ncbi:MAG: septum formation family protein [Actinotalea sp.]|nr:septum formation family protein [Actinotalea sp.]
MRVSRVLPALTVAALLLSGCSAVEGLTGPDEAVRDTGSGEITEASEADAFSVRVGDCLSLLESPAADATEIESLPTVPCGEPHDSEVYAATELPEGDYPGEEEVGAVADEFCYDEFEAFVGTSYEESALDFTTLFPTAQSWDGMDDREILCVVVDGEGGVTGSLRDAGR